MILVLASPEAEQLSRSANGLSVAELLRPHGVFRQLNFNNGGAPWAAAGPGY